jgi:HD-GYP domain-containing protein (c-di-GMP phosphodiesterase class II)
MKQHPIVGHEILSRIDGVSDVVLNCALYHHERLDGSGYPHGLTEEQIPIEAQIMAVADMYDAILSDRVYKSRTSPFEAAHILWENAFNGKLNGKVVSRFVNYLLSLYVGRRAELQDGREVEVVLIHNNEPLRPLVKIVGGDYIDLRQHRHLTIQKFLA